VRRILTLSLLALSALSGGAHAQAAARGWIGVSYGVREESDGSRTVVVGEVMRGSPAESAGIRTGDRLLAIDDLVGADELLELPRRMDLRAGQEVSILLERGDRRVRLRLLATERPLAAFPIAGAGGSSTSDSLVEVTFRAMDDLRARILMERGSGPSGGSTPAWFDVEARMGPQGVRAPFEFFVFRGESHDSLLGEMQELERALARLRLEQGARLAELRGSSRTRSEAEQDRELQDVREEIEELTRRSARLAAAMSEAARATAGVEYMLGRTSEQRERAASGGSVRSSTQERGTFRPLTPYLLGSNRVAGAEVVAVGSELGAYFGVSDGLLIVGVAPGTPAAIAGMRPGDVVTRLGPVGVRSVEELRYGVAQAGDTLRVTLFRQGSSLQVLLRRR